MDNNEYTIYCAKCGAEMGSNSRYCMKCGTLNYDHEANKNMKGYMPKDMKLSYRVGSGKFLQRRRNNSNQVRTTIAGRTGNQKLCFFINIFLFLISIVGAFLITVQGNYSFDSIIHSNFPILSIIISVIFFYVYSFQLLFMKCNIEWWKALIPIYNMIVLADVLLRKKWIGILTCIPGIGIIGFLVIFYQLGIRFQYNGIFTAILPIISLPMIGFGNHLYDGCMFADGDPNLAFEKDYKRKKYYLIIVGIIFLFGVGVFIYNRVLSAEGGSFLIGDYYYVYAAKRITKKVEKNVASGNITCDRGDFAVGSGIYYFYFNDLGDEIFLPLYLMREVISGYVKVDYTSGQVQYYVSVADGQKGFPEILISDLKASSVSDYPKVVSYNGSYMCEFGKSK